MVCENTGKDWYENKKERFRNWYWMNKRNADFRERVKLKSREQYKRSREGIKNMKDRVIQLELENAELREIIEDLKDLIDFDDKNNLLDNINE